MKAIDWQRHEKNIRVKVEHWFQIMDRQLFPDPYEAACTGFIRVMLSKLGSVEFHMERNDVRDHSI
jgi:hypothetical protein